MMKRRAQVWAVFLLAMTSVSTVHGYPTVNVQSKGATANDATNDTAAFQAAAADIQAAGGGTLNIPAGTYIVGAQTAAGGYYRQGQDVFKVSNVSYLLIDGHGAVLRTQAGMKFGSFDPSTGSSYTPSSMPFYDYSKAASIGSMITVIDSENVTIQNLELDGNNTNITLGGEWGDTGRQLHGMGMNLSGNSSVLVSGINSHNHALDGIQIGAGVGLLACDSPTPHTLTNCSFTYNARQGLSWIGGIGLTATGCTFSHTGRAINGGVPFASSPGAGLDIEAEESVVRNGFFQNCEFVNNSGPGLLAESGDGGYSTFAGCTFWGTTFYSAWSAKPGLKYQDCIFRGTAVHTMGSPDATKATGFLRCTFEDVAWTNGQVFNNGFLLDSDAAGENVSFDNCNFTANATRSIWLGYGGGMAYINNCTFLHKWAGLADHQYMAVIRRAKLSGCRFSEGFPGGTTKQWYIDLNTAVVAGTATAVDGPRVKWQNWSWGPTGTLTPGTYNS